MSELLLENSQIEETEVETPLKTTKIVSVSPSIPKTIEANEELVELCMSYVRVLNPIIQQVGTDNKLQTMIDQYLLMDPEQLDTLSLKQLDQILFILPKVLIWVQDCENEALIAYTDATDAYEHTIGMKASTLPKSLFDVSQVTEKMRIAKVREMFPTEFEQRTREVKTRFATFKKLNGQVKHFERLNDNVKKIREGFVNKLKTEKEGDME